MSWSWAEYDLWLEQAALSWATQPCREPVDGRWQAPRDQVGVCFTVMIHVEHGGIGLLAGQAEPRSISLVIEGWSSRAGCWRGETKPVLACWIELDLRLKCGKDCAQEVSVGRAGCRRPGAGPDRGAASGGASGVTGQLGISKLAVGRGAGPQIWPRRSRARDVHLSRRSEQIGGEDRGRGKR